jgi:hypothetical protein
MHPIARVVSEAAASEAPQDSARTSALNASSMSHRLLDVRASAQLARFRAVTGYERHLFVP